MTRSRSAAMRNRIYSFVSAAIIALNSIPFVNLTTANAANSATNRDSVFFPDVEGGSNESAKLYHDDSLVDNGDGTFTFTSKITSAYSYSDYSESRLNSKDGEYILDKEGKYLIEVWGGDGGDGSRSLLTGRNGVGGKGGFIYGILEVSQADVNKKKLVYEIGSKGESSTFQVDGGGGGGSSYTAVMANFTPYATLTSAQEPFFVKQEDNIYADVGGAVVIRYLPENADYGYLNDVKISGTVSSNFDIDRTKSSVVSSTDPSADPIAALGGTGNNIEFTGSIAPVSSGIAKGQADDSLTLKLVLKPKTNFMGGNKVPIFADDGEFTCKTMVARFYENNDINSTTDKQRSFAYAENVRYVNIPFKYKAGAVSKTISIDTQYDESDIIDSTVTNTLDENFANSVSPQYVAEVDETNKITDFTVADYNTKGLHKFDVVVEVVPKYDGADYVGTANPNPTYIRARSVIEIIEGEKLDGFTVKASKSLDYSSGGYNLSVNMDIDYNDIEVFKTFVGSSTVTDYPNTTQSEFGTEYTGTLDKGYYFIDIYGADGGNSGSYTGAWNIVYPPAYGGNGQRKYGFIKIENNNTPYSVYVGQQGSNGQNKERDDYSTALGSGNKNTDAYREGSGGTGGKPSYRELSIGDNSINGDDGTVTESGSKTLSSTLSVDGINNAHTDLSLTANVNTNNATIEDGCIRITKLAVSYGILDEDGNITYFDNVKDLNTEISSRATTFKGYLTDGFTVEETYSEYFTFDSATGNNCTLEEVTPTEDSKIKYKLKLSSETANTLSVNTEAYSGDHLILHEDVNNPSATITSYKYNFNALNVGINAKYLPVDNLVGGNDIPLLAVKTLAEINDYTGGNDAYMAETENTVEADVTKSGGVITVTIPRSSFTDNITIEAEGVAKKKYKVHYWYEFYDPETPNMIQTTEFVDAGPPYHISDAVVDHTGTLAPNPADYPPWGGYVDYYWEWPDGVTSGTHTIVDGDIYVIGKFVKRNVPLTITYVMSDGSTAPDAYSAPLEGYKTTVYDEAEDKYYFYLTAGDAYSVRSPDVAGYVPDKAVVAGIAPENGSIEVTVTYSPNTDPADTEVIVNYVKCDGDGIPILGSDTRRETYTGVKDEEGNFNLERSGKNVVNNKVRELLSDGQIIRRSKLVTKSSGKEEVDVESISGKLEAGEKAEFYVYYRQKPDVVTVKFNKVPPGVSQPAEANITIGMTSRKVVPTREYGYDPDKNQYVGLPRAECNVSGEDENDWLVNGWRFVGWYDSAGNPVDETTIVPSGIDPIELYAHWQPLQVTISIEHKYAFNVSNEEKQGESIVELPTETITKAYGMVYKVESPPLTGYTPDPDFVKGEALTSKTETVYYKDEVGPAPEKTLRIESAQHTCHCRYNTCGSYPYRALSEYCKVTVNMVGYF